MAFSDLIKVREQRIQPNPTSRLSKQDRSGSDQPEYVPTYLGLPYTQPVY